MNMDNKLSEIIWYTILYPIAGIMLLILSYDIYTGKAYIKDGGTLPHQVYILVLPVLIHVIWKKK
jgi:hypothetical protein